MQVEIKIKNYSQVERAIKRAPGILRNGLASGIKKAAYIIERESKKVTPVDTGRLRGSIYTTITPLVATIQPKTNYAIYVHEGTKYMRARPYMREGVENAEREIGDIFNSEIKSSLNKIK